MITTTIDERLAELGIELPSVVTAVAAYLPALRSGTYVYTAGQLPLVDGVMQNPGRVGTGEGLVSPEDARRSARLCAINAVAAVRDELGSLERVTRVVKVTGFVASDPEFFGQSAVLDGASDVLAEIFGEAGRHVRSAVGVAALPRDAPVEVELVVEHAA